MYATGIYRSADQINTAMARVYRNMFLAVITSMAVSYLVGTSHALMSMFFTGAMMWVVMLLPIALVFIVPIVIASKPPAIVSHAMLHVFAAAMGLSLATVFAVYTMASIVSAFMGAAVLFGVMSIYGYFTKQSLDSIGKYAFVALIAIIIASIINIFIGSSVLQTVISAIAIVVFLALTAYDTQQIREMVTVERDEGAEVLGALTLYLDFINLFIHLLQLFGVKNDD